ncbi:alpha-2-macroglobulin family protein [Chitinophaga sp. GbtcB8]|uniref:carboxypeptidase-like regulatory domain-containing protein n=1 Tax=Chitinophaga sp. GbtcB8 TaxID=2824753 RepID=UPI001C305661|nr:alpha-2-macroglobulin family protein [Chitinophaga sp. GbtcB8]
MKYLITSVLFLACFCAHAQHNLSGSLRHSLYTYVYRIDNKEAAQLSKDRLEKENEKYLHSLVDSFKTGDELPALSDGNYLLVNASGNRLEYQLYTAGNVRIKLVSNDHDQQMAVHDKQGRLITDATVYLNKRRLPYNKERQTYGPVRSQKNGAVTVYYKNTHYYFPVGAYRYHTPFFRSLTYHFPLKYFFHRQRNNSRYGNYFRAQTPYEKKFRGFMVLNKNKFKPGDTLRLKAFITNHKGRPVNEPLLLRLTDEYLDLDTILTTIQPYRPGAYVYEMVVSDSLDLDLDDEYLLTLEETRSKKYNLGDYDGDLDDNEYASLRNVLVRTKFEYEEYELHSITFSARSSKPKHYRGEELSVFLKATDENDMPVMDGRVELFVLNQEHAYSNFHAPRVFLPDTLWSFTQTLETTGETRVNIPDSIFPKASFSYVIQCHFLNSDNESQHESLYQSFANAGQHLAFELQDDSLKIEHYTAGKTSTASGILYVFGEENDTLEQRTITLPTIIKIHPFATSYTVTSNQLTDSYNLSHAGGAVSCQAMRSRDSVFVRLVNPYHLPVWYTIFAGNKIVLRGYSDTLLYQERTHTAGNYNISLQYIYGNKVQKENYLAAYQDKLLNIHSDQPAFVYPGQTVNINLHVTDANGQAVPDADVTAYALTKKLRAPAPYVPYQGRSYANRKMFRGIALMEHKRLSATERLNWQRWSREMKLDTIEYYKFLHPQNLYVNREPAAHAVTQLAPFVTGWGDLTPVHLIYIDERPVFFSQSQPTQHYSFRVKEGWHNIRLRTADKLITLDSIWITPAEKTVISVDEYAQAKNISIKKMPDTLTNYEKALWSKYMLLIENNFYDGFAYLRHYPDFYLLGQNSYNAPYLAGPFPENQLTLVVKNQFEQGFEAEGNWRYNIAPGLIKQKQLGQPYPFSSRLYNNPVLPNFSDYVLTEKDIDSLWQEFLDNRSRHTTLPEWQRTNKTGNGKLKIGLPENDKQLPGLIKNVILFRYDDLDFLRVYPGAMLDLGYQQPGLYRVLLLKKKNDYLLLDSLHILPDGVNYYEANKQLEKPADSMSIKIARIIESREGYNSVLKGDNDMDRIKETFNSQYLDVSSFTNIINGIVKDNKGAPLPGVSIIIKGTSNGTLTNSRGEFKLKVPANGTINIMYIGYLPQQFRIQAGNYYTITLWEDEQKLEEVVVVGYGTTVKKLMTGSVSTVETSALAGRVAGVFIRGVNSVSGNTAPLIIVDGLPYNGTMESIDAGLLDHITVLKADAATALYGAQAAGGAIIITTKKAAQTAEIPLPTQGNTLRRNFRDDAYWQPKLLTNAQGNASFTTTFPDDITNWQTFAIAITDKKQSGYLQGAIRSFKALSASINLPQFAITGDSIQVIGKTLNYQPEASDVKRSFSINGRLVKEGNIHVRNSLIDTFAVTAANNDSLKLQYTIQKPNGYFDGEERAIPVFKPGVTETNGYFAALHKDTTLRIPLLADTGVIKVHAEASLLPAWEEETERLRTYEYLCNEQLASKLKALLVQKKIDAYLKKPFDGDQNIKELIKKLNESKAGNGLWGWWAGNEPQLWISQHAMEALLAAAQSGYTIPVNKQMLIDYLVYNQESYRGVEKLNSLYILQQLGAKANFKTYVDSLEKQNRNTGSLYLHLRLAEFKQSLNLPVRLDTFIAKQQHTAFGNTYWGADNYQFFDNSIQLTLCMYRMLRQAGGYDDLLQSIRGYFLEKRSGGHWRNTYESALILETILPDLLADNATAQPATLTIDGPTHMQVTTFPFNTTLKGGSALTVSKQGGLPLYFTAYQQRWNAAPDSVSGNFTVHTVFEEQAKTVARLKAGTPVILKATVTVKGDADYVMIEIPIPAGCSYQDKSQSYRYNEVHREHFKNKVSIFCRSLSKGVYEFRVSLLPRYGGVYTLNPAKAEMMYFPVFYGREGIKKVEIK